MTSVQTLELKRALNETHIAPKHKKGGHHRPPFLSTLSSIPFLRFIAGCSSILGVLAITLICLFGY